jgi:hypothetical protein
VKPRRKRAKPEPEYVRLARIRAVRIAAERGGTHEKIALDLGLSPLRVIGICERHQIPVARGLQPCRRMPGFELSDRAAIDDADLTATGTRRIGGVDVIEQRRRLRKEAGGYVVAKLQPDPRRQLMAWEPGGDPARPPLFSCAAEDGSAVEYNPPPLASLGDPGAPAGAQRARNDRGGPPRPRRVHLARHRHADTRHPHPPGGEAVKPRRKRAKPEPEYVRLARIRAVRIAAERGGTHEKIALDLGLSPLRVIGICERHQIPVARGLQPCRRMPGFELSDRAAIDDADLTATGTRRIGGVDVIEQRRRLRKEAGGYVVAKLQPDPRRQLMAWEPGGDPARPPLFSCAAEDGSAVEYNPPPLASLGDPGAPAVSRAPVPRGAPGKSPSWGMSGAGSTMPPVQKHFDRGEEAEAERRRKMRVAQTAKPNRRRAEVRA